MAIAVISNRNIENPRTPLIVINSIHYPIAIRIIGTVFKRTDFNISVLNILLTQHYREFRTALSQ